MRREDMDGAVIGRKRDEDILFQAAVEKGDLIFPVTIGIGIVSRHALYLISVERLCKFFGDEFIASVCRNDDRFHDALGTNHACHGTSIDIVKAGYMVSFDEIGDILHEKIIRAIVTDERVGQGEDLPFIGRICETFLIACHAGIEDQFPQPFDRA